MKRPVRLAPARLVVLSVLLSSAPSRPEPASGPGAESRRVVVSSDLTAVLAGGAITVETRPLDGETPIEFARRIAADDGTVQRILTLPGGPSRSRVTVLQYGALSNEAKRAAATALFPSDVRATVGWLHIAVADEPLSSIAEWFTGSAAGTAAIARHNGLTGTAVSRGSTVRVPAELLLPPFRDADVVIDEEPPGLEFGGDEKGRFAIYRLRKKEALYSAVVVRFTGRLHASDVVELALKIALRSGIEDVHAIPVGYPVKIPLEELSPEFLPEEDPRAQELVKERAEASQFAIPVQASGLAGVRVILDAGHGGRDTGTLHAGIWESTYVYDVACRLRKILLETTKAEVVMTTREAPDGWPAPEKDRLVNRRDRQIVTDPPYRLDDPVVGVNLRWYLANSLLRRPGPDRKRVPPERIVFLSIHADSLHPSVRGAMAYVPGERFLRDRYGKSNEVYRLFREYREEPVVSFNKKERVAAEGVSTKLAEKLIGALRSAGLPVHRFSPVRTHVIRGGREWVPAVLRYNRVPNRVLLEISNLGNEEDRSLTVTRAFRQRAAAAIASGIVDFFGGRPDRTGEPTLRAADRRAAPGAPPDRPIGPWPEPAGPLPEAAGPWPERAGPRPRG